MPSIHGLCRRAFNGYNKRRARALIPCLLVKLDKPLKLETLGEGGGAWTVPLDLIGSDWTCYCVGVGLDATFDVALVERCGAQVWSLDPTPRAVEYMKRLGYCDPRHHFEPVAMWESNTTLRFFAPMNHNHVNLSTRDIHGTGSFVEVPAETMKTIMRRLGHERVDLLKIDIEGSWDVVIANIAAEGIAPQVLCVEFDTPTSPAKVRRAVAQLDGLGLKPIHQARDNVLFVHQQLIN